MEVCGPQQDHHFLGWEAGVQDIAFYADDGSIMRRNPIWVQSTLTTHMQMFEQVGLHTNLGKTNETTCTPSFILWNLGKEAYKQQHMGKCANFGGQKHKKVSFSKCSVTIMMFSIRKHMERTNGRRLAQTQKSDTS